MPIKIPKYIEFRILAILASLALGIYLFQVLAGFIALFSDLILILLLSWILAFVLDPLVDRLEKKIASRMSAALIVYSLLGLAMIALIAFVIPTTANQLRVLLAYLPEIFNQTPVWTGRLETIVTTALSNSIIYAQTLASLLAGSLLVIIISFYLVLSGTRLEVMIANFIPQNLREDYTFLLRTLNATFASFLRVQVVIGLIVGLITIVILALLSVEFALSAGLLAGLFAMIPVVGPIISIVPPLLAAATVSIEKAIIVTIVLFLVYQLVYNIISPKLVGSALKIHPVFVLLAFIVGYKLAGFWGAVFAVPVAVSVAIVLKELYRHWQHLADNS